MTDYPKPKPLYQEQQEEKRYSWIDDDCRVVECFDGLIPIDDGQYTTAYRCPDCARFFNPTIAVYSGPVTYRTAAEMLKRREERKEIYFQGRRANTRVNAGIAGIGKI